MEFLNSLWIAISTPNEGLINVILFFGGFIEAFIAINIFLALFKISTTRKSKVTYIILNSFFSSLSRFFIPNPFNMIINYIVTFILTKTIFKTKSLKSIARNSFFLYNF